MIGGGAFPHGARRAIAYGDGWMPHVRRPEYGGADVTQFLPEFRKLAAEAGRDAAVREVWKAYTDLKTALRKQESAAKLLTASQNAFDAVLESYKQGLSTYPEIATAHNCSSNS